MEAQPSPETTRWKRLQVETIPSWMGEGVWIPLSGLVGVGVGVGGLVVERVKEREVVLELMFGWGRWQCLGRNAALMELNKVFVELLRNFELEVVNPTEPWKSFCGGIFTQRDMWLRATKRGRGGE
jgi:hypothetical protein